jgi:hypothetical protein
MRDILMFSGGRTTSLKQIGPTDSVSEIIVDNFIQDIDTVSNDTTLSLGANALQLTKKILLFIRKVLAYIIFPC